jgi:hypothetical protein
VVAAVLAGAVVALSVVLATASTSVLQPVGAARSFRFATAGGRTVIVSVPPNARLRTSWVEVPANARPGSVTIVGPANAPPGAVRVQVPAAVLPAGGNAQPGRWVQVPARVWVQVPARVVVPAPAASPANSTAH